MIRRLRYSLLILTGIVLTGIRAQPGPTPDNQWLLEDYRPVLPAQFCENPRIVSRSSFDGTMEECIVEFERLFDKCVNESPNVRLRAEFRNKEEQAWSVSFLYECMSSHYIGGATLEEFNLKYPVEQMPVSEPAE